MAFSIAAGTGVAGAAAPTLTPGLPAAGVVAGDLLLLLVDVTQAATVTATGYTQVHSAAAASDDFRIFTKTAGGSEAAPTVSISGGVDCCAMIVRVRGWDTAGGPAQFTTSVSSTTTSSIDPPTTGSVKIGIVHGDPTTAGTVTWSGGSTGLGEIGYLARCFLSAAYKVEDTAGALTFTTTITGAVATTILSIAPAAATPPVAAFSGTPLTGDAPLNVTFTDASTNTPTSWAWDFGDSGTSTSQNPSHNYTVPGTYDVELVATNAGGSDTETKVGYVTADIPSEPLDYAEGGGITIG